MFFLGIIIDAKAKRGENLMKLSGACHEQKKRVLSCHLIILSILMCWACSSLSNQDIDKVQFSLMRLVNM